jgi:dihydrofolate reductase
MRNVIYSMMVSLDGFTARPNGELDWVIVDEELHTFINDQQSEVGTYLHGRRMYELMSAYWPTADEDPSAPPYMVEFSRIWKDMPKVVFSKTLERVEWNARLVRSNIADEIAKLKGQPGKDMVIGGPSIASAVMHLGLIDDYRLFVQPAVLGSGKPMFPVPDYSASLRLVDTRAFASGVVYLRYRTEQEAM